MPKDHKRHLIHDMKGSFYEVEKETYKSKPRPIVMSDQMKEYLIARDRILWKEGKSIDELKIKYGV